MKSGIKTTEFWITGSAIFISGALAYLQTVPTPWAVTSVTVLSALYTVLRSSLKNKQP